MRTNTHLVLLTLFTMSACAAGDAVVCDSNGELLDGECIRPPRDGRKGNDDNTSVPTGTGSGSSTGTGTGSGTGSSVQDGPHLIFGGTSDLGVVEVPCATSVELRLENDGTADLIIERIDHHSDGAIVLDPYSLPALPATVAPGAGLSLVLAGTPTDDGADTGTLVVASNDDRGELSATQTLQGAWAEVRTETFSPPLPMVDVMLLIDQSCSMEDDNFDDIEIGLPLFVEGMDANTDWQLIQVTHFNGCANVGVMDPSNINVERLVEEAFNSNHHNRTEALLELAAVAMGETDNGCNTGFRRPDAQLHVVAISDERHQSSLPWNHWLDELGTYVASEELLTVSSVVDVDRRCGDNSGPGGYLEASNASNGSILDICQSTWGTQMGELIAERPPGPGIWTLADTPLEDTIEVAVNGNPTTDWLFDSATDALTVTEPISDDDEVVVTYAIPGVCP